MGMTDIVTDYDVNLAHEAYVANLRASGIKLPVESLAPMRAALEMVFAAKAGEYASLCMALAAARSDVKRFADLWDDSKSKLAACEASLEIARATVSTMRDVVITSPEGIIDARKEHADGSGYVQACFHDGVPHFRFGLGVRLVRAEQWDQLFGSRLDGASPPETAADFAP